MHQIQKMYIKLQELVRSVFCMFGQDLHVDLHVELKDFI